LLQSKHSHSLNQHQQHHQIKPNQTKSNQQSSTINIHTKQNTVITYYYHYYYDSTGSCTGYSNISITFNAFNDIFLFQSLQDNILSPVMNQQGNYHYDTTTTTTTNTTTNTNVTNDVETIFSSSSTMTTTTTTTTTTTAATTTATEAIILKPILSDHDTTNTTTTTDSTTSTCTAAMVVVDDDDHDGSGSSSSCADSHHGTSTILSFTEGFRDKVKGLFDHFDIDHDGFLKYSELAALQAATTTTTTTITTDQKDNNNNKDEQQELQRQLLEILSPEMYVMTCQALNCHPDNGISLEALKFIYSSKGADIDQDYDKVFTTTKTTTSSTSIATVSVDNKKDERLTTTTTTTITTTSPTTKEEVEEEEDKEGNKKDDHDIIRNQVGIDGLDISKDEPKKGTTTTATSSCTTTPKPPPSNQPATTTTATTTSNHLAQPQPPKPPQKSTLIITSNNTKIIQALDNLIRYVQEDKSSQHDPPQLSHYRVIPPDVQRAYTLLENGAQLIHGTATKFTLMGKISLQHDYSTKQEDNNAANNNNNNKLGTDLLRGCELIGASLHIILQDTTGCSRAVRKLTHRACLAIFITVLQLAQAMEDLMLVSSASSTTSTTTSTTSTTTSGNNESTKRMIINHHHPTPTQSNSSHDNIEAQKTGAVWEACDHILQRLLPQGNRNAIRRELFTWIQEINDSMNEFQAIVDMGPSQASNYNNNNNKKDDDDDDDDLFGGGGDDEEQYNDHDLPIAQVCLGLLKNSRGNMKMALETCEVLGGAMMGDHEKDQYYLESILTIHKLARVIGEGSTDLGSLMYPPLQEIMTELSKQFHQHVQSIQALQDFILNLTGMPPRISKLAHTLSGAANARKDEFEFNAAVRGGGRSIVRTHQILL
jgi:hypothetical protein